MWKSCRVRKCTEKSIFPLWKFSFFSRVHFQSSISHVDFLRANECPNLNQLISCLRVVQRNWAHFVRRCLKFAFAHLDVGAFALRKRREHDWKCELWKVDFSTWILSMNISVEYQRAWTWSEVSGRRAIMCVETSSFCISIVWRITCVTLGSEWKCPCLSWLKQFFCFHCSK